MAKPNCRNWTTWCKDAIGNGIQVAREVTVVTAHIRRQEDSSGRESPATTRFGGDAMLLFHFMLLIAIGVLFLVVPGTCKEFHELWASLH
jgi:hypothetical protein